MYRKALLALFVFVCACLPFVRSVGYGQINCDDVLYFDNCPEVTSGLSLVTVSWAMGYVGDAIWMPVTWIAFAADHSVAKRIGLSPERVAHAGNVLFHGLNGTLVFVLILLLLKRNGRGGSAADERGRVLLAAVGALLWAVHPLRVESVAWLASKKDVLSGFFFLLALCEWVRWRMGEGRWHYVASMVAIVVGACCKPSVMVFIGVILVLDVLMGVDGDPIVRRPFVPMKVLPYLLPGLICTAIALEAHFAQGAGAALSAASCRPVWWNLVNALTSCGVYVIHTVIPANLACQCLARYPMLPRLAVPGVLVSVAIAWFFGRRLVKWCRGDRGTDVCMGGAVWFFGTLLPFLGLVGFGYHAYADRFTYLPSVGLVLAGVMWWYRNFDVALGNGLRKGVMAAVIPVMFALMLLSFRQTGFWHDDRILWLHTLSVDGDRHVMAHMNVALWHFEYDHGSSETVRHFRKAIELGFPAAADLAPIVVLALCEEGHLEEAAEFLRSVQKHMDESDAVRRNSMMGRVERAPLDNGGSFPYELARIAYFAYCPKYAEVASDELAKLMSVKPLDRNLLYLKGLLADRNGDHDQARYIWSQMREKGTGKDAYVRYRFTAAMDHLPNPTIPNSMSM